ncbi:MAG: putative DNA modification/repair radical SAM protein [Clostridium fessum]
MLIQENLSIEEKLRILSDAAKYDAACTSSGVGRKGKEGFLGNSRVDGICHSFASDGRCISLLKILFTNQCIYDCHYCVNRRSNDTVRTSFTPEEVCCLTMEFYRRNYIEGLFLSSGVLETPDHTMELLYQTLYRLRRVHRFNGYIHVKAIPGADPELIERVGFLADRMSVNLELPTADGLARLAPGKTRDKILRPMRQIQTGIARQLEQEGRLESRGAWLPQKERGEIQIPGDGRYGIGGKAIGKGEKECLQADKEILSLNQTETKMDWGRNGDKVKGFMRSKEPGERMKGLEGHIHRRSPVSSRDARSMAVSDWEISQTARIISSPAVRARSSLSGRLRRVIIRWLQSRKRCIGILD